MLKHTFLRVIAPVFFPFLLVSASATAQEDLSVHWDGTWVVEGTLFSIAVIIEDEKFKVRQIESLGFEWTSKNGSIDGNVVTVEIKYAGVAGTIQAELVNPNTAVAYAATCLPEFMVVCMLSKDRQAVFRKVAEK